MMDETTLKIVEAAYVALCATRWPGRGTWQGQELLCALRHEISNATGASIDDVQGAANAELAKMLIENGQDERIAVFQLITQVLRNGLDLSVEGSAEDPALAKGKEMNNFNLNIEFPEGFTRKEYKLICERVQDELAATLAEIEVARETDAMLERCCTVDWDVVLERCRAVDWDAMPDGALAVATDGSGNRYWYGLPKFKNFAWRGWMGHIDTIEGVTLEIAEKSLVLRPGIGDE